MSGRLPPILSTAAWVVLASSVLLLATTCTSTPSASDGEPSETVVAREPVSSVDIVVDEALNVLQPVTVGVGPWDYPEENVTVDSRAEAQALWLAIELANATDHWYQSASIDPYLDFAANGRLHAGLDADFRAEFDQGSSTVLREYGDQTRISSIVFEYLPDSPDALDLYLCFHAQGQSSDEDRLEAEPFASTFQRVFRYDFSQPNPELVAYGTRGFVSFDELIGCPGHVGQEARDDWDSRWLGRPYLVTAPPCELDDDCEPEHWHAVVALYDCRLDGGQGGYLAPVATIDRGRLAEEEHVAGIARLPGKNATLADLNRSALLEVNNDRLILPWGEIWANDAASCNGDAAVLQVHQWDFWFVASNGEPANEVITSNFDDYEVGNDGQVFVYALASAGVDVPPPPAEQFLEFDAHWPHEN